MKPILLLDGPLGTELERLGFETRLPRWSADAVDRAPELLARIHRSYAEAGATVHTANTFRTQRRNVGDAFARMTRAAVQIARSSVPAEHRVFGSIAPLFDCYRPDLSPPDSEFEHREMADALADAGVDGLLCETFPSPPEAEAALRAALRTGLPTWVSLTAGPDGSLVRPEDAREFAIRACDLGAEAVLVNCIDAARTRPFVQAIAGAGLPFGAYANCGVPDDEVGFRPDTQPIESAVADYLARAREWASDGATVIGSCCGTRPEHIQALRTWIDQR